MLEPITKISVNLETKRVFIIRGGWKRNLCQIAGIGASVVLLCSEIYTPPFSRPAWKTASLTLHWPMTNGQGWVRSCGRQLKIYKPAIGGLCPPASGLLGARAGRPE